MLPWEQISSALVMVAVIMRKLLMNWMQLVSTIQKTTTRNFSAKHPNWLIYGSETSSATRTRGSYFRPEQELIHSNQDLDRHYEQSDYGNDRLVGVKQQQLLGLLTVTTLVMLDSLSGQVRTISVNLHHGTTKTKLQLRVLTLVS